MLREKNRFVRYAIVSLVFFASVVYFIGCGEVPEAPLGDPEKQLRQAEAVDKLDKDLNEMEKLEEKFAEDVSDEATPLEEKPNVMILIEEEEVREGAEE